MNETVRKIFGSKNCLGRRYVILLVGLLICSFGIACTTKAGLGTSPIASIPYTLSLIFTKCSFGLWAFAFGMAQILVQIILLKGKVVITEMVIQAVLALVFGYATEFSMFLISGITLDLYIFKLLFFILGCVIVALGVYLELLGDVAMLSGDAFIKVIAQVAHRQYGNIKIINDISMTAISAVLCLIFLNALVGVREGTVIAAFIVGPIIRICQKVFKPLGEKLLLDENK